MNESQDDSGMRFQREEEYEEEEFEEEEHDKDIRQEMEERRIEQRVNIPSYMQASADISSAGG